MSNLKICLTSKGKDMSSELDLRFGRCQQFIIFDTESKEYDVIENSGFSSAHGAGVSAAQQVANEKVSVVITGSLGPNAMNILSADEIKGFIGKSMSLEENIKAYENNELSEITKAGKAHH